MQFVPTVQSQLDFELVVALHWSRICKCWKIFFN